MGRYEIYDTETAEIINTQDFIKDIKTKEDFIKMQRHLDSIKLERKVDEDKTPSINVLQKRNQRRFLMMFVVSLENEVIDSLEDGSTVLLHKLYRYLKTDGSCKLDGGDSKAYFIKKLNRNKNTFYKHFDELEKANIVKFVKAEGIYINPNYIRYGNKIHIYSLQLFNLFYDGNDLVELKGKK